MIQENNLTSLNDELTFLNDEYGTSVNSDCFTHDEVYKALGTISPTYNLYLHINISSLVTDLKYLLEKCNSTQYSPTIVKLQII